MIIKIKLAGVRFKVGSYRNYKLDSAKATIIVTALK
jgi:hypothetical protein